MDAAVTHAIVFVPGIRPKPPPELQLTELRRCLAYGVERIGGSAAEAQSLAGALRLVGWSHEFYGEHGDIAPDIPGIERLLSGRDTDEDALRAARSLGRRTVGLAYRLADRFPFLGTHASTERMRTRVDEMRRYFDNEDGHATRARSQVEGAVREAWARATRVMLVGHSFGAVIAWDSLWELCRNGQAQSVSQFMTMGSPITMSYIRARLLGARETGRARYPDCIERWVNLNAVGEVATGLRTAGECFAPMRSAGLVGRIEDDFGLVNRFVGPEGFNPHKCYGYFASDRMAEYLLAWYRDTARRR